MHPFQTSLLMVALAVAPLAVGAQDTSVAAGSRRPPPATGVSRGASPAPSASIRRGARGAAPVPLTDVAIALGSARYNASVDAHCAVDEKATTTNTRAYLTAMNPWFGQRPASGQPQWRFTLELRRSPSTDTYKQFVFAFNDGAKSGTIQTVAGSVRMGSGTVRVTRRAGAGARFEVNGRGKEGEVIRATINCPRFSGGESAGG